jgi:tetratricopeptide (TPR) repeat protein
MTQVQPVPSVVEQEIHRIRSEMERGEFALAAEAVEKILTLHPHNRDALYMKAVSLRYLNRMEEALNTLDRLERSHPNYSLLFQERGHCFMMLKDADNALDAFMHAVNINPALPASWARLQLLHRMKGESENERMAGEHLATLARLPREIVTATGLFSDGDYGLAEQMTRRYLLEHGNHVEAMRLLARIGLALDVLDDGELLLAEVLKIAPQYYAARYDYVRALLQRHKHAHAKTEMELLLAREPSNRNYRLTYATILVGLGQHEEALQVHRTLLSELGPEPTPGVGPRAKYDPFRERALLHLSVGHSLKTLGRQTEAIEAYRNAARVRPDFGDAYWSLANLKTYRFTEAEISAMRTAEADERTQPIDRYHLAFALAKGLEDQGRYEESFAFYERGNGLKRAENRFNITPIERNTRDQIKVCTPELFSQLSGVGCTAPDPIFIVGLPRSGSTLIEQILSSHSQVDATAELADIARLVLELSGRDMTDDFSRYPACLPALKPEDFRKFGEGYLADTRVYRGQKPRFIDKMPNNFRHIGLIHLILPNAKIIDARRDPMACCFSNFKQLFASGQEFTYSIEDIARYYRTYVELMDHWDRVLPGRVLCVQHEDLVDNLESNVRRILDYCELPFEPGCIEFHKTKRSIRTASSEQVRRPIFREGLDQWKHFEPWLAPLKEALGDVLTPS